MSVKRTRPLQCVPGQRGLLSPATVVFFPCFLSHFCPAACGTSPCYGTMLRDSSSHQRGDATSFSSHYVLIRGCYRGGGEDQKQAEMCRRTAHTITTRPSRDEGCPSAASLKATLKLSAHFLLTGRVAKKKKKKRCNNWKLLLFVAMSTEICKHLAQRWTRSRSSALVLKCFFFGGRNHAFIAAQ